jgi:predicted metalloprotease
MRWIPGRRSQNLEDRRGQRFGGFGRLGLGGAVIVLILSLVFGRDFTGLLGGGGEGGSQSAPDGSGTPVQSTPAEERLVDFVSFVLDSAQATWARILPQAGARYRDAKLVLFRDGVHSACGFGQAATGPFYCPGDERVYIDLGFFEELETRFGAPGDFAQAYVLAHEIGHHVQNLLGTLGTVRDNQQSVTIELQADCLAGIWGHHASLQNLIEPGDVDEGMGAAAAVGDDRSQRMSTGRVNPDNFTHGSSAQRVASFRRGLTSGRVADCDRSSAR